MSYYDEMAILEYPLNWRSTMKKLSVLLIFMLVLTVGAGCGKKKPEPAKTPQAQTQQQNPHTAATFPPASAEDKAAIESSMKDFWAALNDKDETKINAMIFKSKPDTAKQILDGLKKAEVNSFEFKKLTGVTANNGLAAAGYIVLRDMGQNMKTKFPEIQTLPFVKDKDTWKVVLSQDAVTPQEVTTLTNMLMQEQQKQKDDPDIFSYQKMQQDFEKEAKDTKQKFYEEAVKQQQQQQQQQQSGANPHGGGAPQQLPAGHPKTGQ